MWTAGEALWLSWFPFDLSNTEVHGLIGWQSESDVVSASASHLRSSLPKGRAVEFDLSDLSCSCTAMYAIARERWNMIEQWMQDFQGDPLCCYDIVMHFIILYHIPNFEGFRHTEQPWSMRSAFLGDGVACLSYAEDLKTSIIEDRRPGSARPCRWMSQAPFQKSQWQHEETDALSF